MRHHSPSLRGFSLLEMSIVLLVIAFVAGFGVTLGSDILSGSDRVTTQQRLITIRQALDAYVAKNGYLPCPASRAIPPTDPNFGVGQLSTQIGTTSFSIENPDSEYLANEELPVADRYGFGFTGTFATPTFKVYTGADKKPKPVIITNPGTAVVPGASINFGWHNPTSGLETKIHALFGTVCVLPADGSVFNAGGAYVGAVPITTLGLPASYAMDAWNNKFLYAVSVQHVSDVGSYAKNPTAIEVRYGDRSPGANYPITKNSDGTPGGATYVVLSHGPDGKGAYSINGTQTACTDAGQTDVLNCKNIAAGVDATFYDTEYNDVTQGPGYFDDYIIWGSNAVSVKPKAITTAGLGSGCAPGVCEPWCATCQNAPAYTGDASFVSYVCSSTITQNIPCQAQCTYAYFGTASDAKTYAIPCP